MKFLYDYFPVICFFIAYKFFGIYAATATAIAASFFQMGFFWFKKHSFEKLHVITFVLILTLGSFTLIFHKPIFIQWKPSIIYWIFGIVLFGSQFFSSSPLLQRMLSGKIELPSRIWGTLNLSWAIFFTLMGFANLYVVYHYSTNVWVDFKLFGTLGLTILFAVIQAVCISKYIRQVESSSSSS
ncbi:MAG: septation protein A [Gammaproteobacteria bacterium RIFOXYB2_FULL_38_6]|nr:MAG: septation protein A [Gammaproteobacteria bacterium RIFOXYB2_FULL_38_6]